MSFVGSGNGRAVLVLRKRLDYDSGERNFNLTIRAQVGKNQFKLIYSNNIRYVPNKDQNQ